MRARAALAAITTGTLSLGILLLGACEPGPKDAVQQGYRGLAQEQNYDVSSVSKAMLAQTPPASLPPAAPMAAGPSPWKNVQVLTDVSPAELYRTMTAMTQWVAPAKNQGCAYCHNIGNFASDSLYPKVVARRMLQMTRYVNNGYASHVRQTGVTCWTCHRGQPVPQAGVWYLTDENQYLRHYLDRDDLRVQSLTVAHTPANHSSIKQAEYTYALMISQSRALGVNCTFCHNTRSFATWQNAPPTRAVALYGIRMVRDLNTNYLTPLHAVFPSYRLGPLGDGPKLQCITCHQGVYKPLYGAQMAKDYPALWGRAQWTDRIPGDTAAAGFRDFRTADSIPTDTHSPRLAAQVVLPNPAPYPGMRPAYIASPATSGAPGAGAEGRGVDSAGRSGYDRVDTARVPGSTPANVPEVRDSARRGTLRAPATGSPTSGSTATGSPAGGAKPPR